MNAVTVRHNFETAHRLPHLGGKCRSLHGHSWWAQATVAGPMRADGTVAEFGPLKASIREWIDRYLDHGTMLGIDDELGDALAADGSCKLFRFGAGADASEAEQYAADMAWPTVENVAVLIGRVVNRLAVSIHNGLRLHKVVIMETAVNAAEYRP